MSVEIVHFAGPICSYGRVFRQRCQWCGALIQEQDLDRIAIQESSRPVERRGQPLGPEDLAWWQGLVAVDGRCLYHVDDPVDNLAPERSCMRILPDGNL